MVELRRPEEAERRKHPGMLQLDHGILVCLSELGYLD